MNNSPMVNSVLRVVLMTSGLLAAPMAAPVGAQDRPGPSIEFTAGWVGFADDGIVSEILLGGNVRWYLLPRISVGPEVTFIDGNGHSHLVVTGNVTFDLFSPANGRPSRVTPFVVIGGGLFQTRESLFTGTFTSREGAFTAGGGIKALVGSRVTVGVDARAGWELHLRIAGLIGVRLGR